MISLEPPRGSSPHEPPSEAARWRAAGLSRAGLTRFVVTAQAAIGLRGEVEVLLAGDRTLRRLNREYRGKNKATDVLSFPGPPELADVHAGDLAVSLETAARQAAEQSHSLRDEVRVLLLHGLLHLHGMDHETDEGLMAAREAVLRRQLRLPLGLIARTESTGDARSPKSRVTAAQRDGATRRAEPEKRTAKHTSTAGERSGGAKVERSGRIRARVAVSTR